MCFTGETISGGTVNVELKLDGIKLYSGKFDVCESLKQGNFSCPLPANNYYIKETTEIPGEAPLVCAHKISVNVKLKSRNFSTIKGTVKFFIPHWG